MKTTGYRAIGLYIILAVFIGGVIYLVGNVFINGGNWVAMPYNGHIYADSSTVSRGTITDRNNLILAYTENGERKYSKNQTIREALLHTVGDSSGYIGTSVQSTMGSKLIGYNFFTGLNKLPENSVLSNDIKLSIDASLSELAYELMGDKRGAVLVSNYETGEILCKVSTPTYDPMNVPSDLRDNEIYSGVFVDNTISSSYTPGSTFKLIVTACALQNYENIDEIKINCSGVDYIGSSTVTCMGKHGEIGVEEALGRSCNIYFARLALMLGEEKLQETAEKMGFNKRFEFEDFTTAKSYVDLENSEDIELAWAGVGQFTTTVNPANMLLLMHAIANGGKAEPLTLTTPSNTGVTSDKSISLLSYSVANQIQQYMGNNVENYYNSSLFPNMDVCAKTGTAEVEGKEDTSWIVGFSANKETPYAFVVVAQEAGFGISFSGKIASELMKKLV